MKTFLDYCFYRAASFYKEWGEDAYLYAGSIVSYGSLGFNILTIIIVVQSLWLNIAHTKTEIIVMAVLTATVCLFLGDNDKFLYLEKKYKKEKHKKMRGWIVFTYWIGSIIVFGISVAVFK